MICGITASYFPVEAAGVTIFAGYWATKSAEFHVTAAEERALRGELEKEEELWPGRHDEAWRLAPRTAAEPSASAAVPLVAGTYSAAACSLHPRFLRTLEWSPGGRSREPCREFHDRCG